MVDVFMLATAAGPNGVWSAGTMQTIPDAQAQELIEGRYGRVATREEKIASAKQAQLSKPRLSIN